MDDTWISQLSQQTALLVPTRSLANTLNERIAAHNIERGLSVWEAPNVLVWNDYLRLLWEANRDMLGDEFGAHNLISTQQSLVLWNQVIEASRRQEQELTLLNVQQTTKAVHRSWRLMHDWRVTKERVRQDHVADTAQFVHWLEAYEALLAKRALIDEPKLLDQLCCSEQLNFPFKNLIWYAYDLVTAAQSCLNEKARAQGVQISQREPESEAGVTQYRRYPDSKTELDSTLREARSYLEANPTHSVNVVVPDLAQRQAQVRDLAREVFYPSASPLQAQQNNTVYRFSLGRTMNEWSAIETALCVVSLLRNRVSVTDLSFLLRNQFLALTSNCRAECRLFDRWLKSQRLRMVPVDSLPALYIQCLEYYAARDQAPKQALLLDSLENIAGMREALQFKLTQAKETNGFSALNMAEWVDTFSAWLGAWGWHTKTAGMELNTVQHQLHQRWVRLMEEFAGLATVQRQAGLVRALDLLQQMARDAMFIPKAVASPVLISSIPEAIGRPADLCYLTGMHDGYPAPARPDAFIPNRLLLGTGFPDASADTGFAQVKRVNTSLFNSVQNAIISYPKLADQDAEVIKHASPVYRQEEFIDVVIEQTDKHELVLERYVDTQGPKWPDPSRAKGGTKIFENQSNCAFKAFVTHQLGFLSEDEAEFGLDARDRGNIVHRLLELIWEQLQSQENLNAMESEDLEVLISSVIDKTFDETTASLNADKQQLLGLERNRLMRLMKGWLSVEAKRPETFVVLEREESYEYTYAGIRFRFIVDRLDGTQDGRTFIIDYKTGQADRKDWIGERVKRPQMPLYAVALDNLKRSDVSGIAYAKVSQQKHEFVELSEQGVFRRATKSSKTEELWQENRGQWEDVFKSLADDFLNGVAKVNPSDDACQYCDLTSVCRVNQLRQNEAAPALNELNEVAHD